MKIIEKDFKIEIVDEVFTLFTLKSKKEIKEDASETYKVAGYFNNITGALRGAIKFRQGKKYPFKESALPLKVAIQNHNKTLASLSSLISEIEVPIVEMKRSLKWK